MGVWIVSDTREIADYLKNMSFKKKAIGGCDQEDVLDKFEDVTLLYQKILKDMDAKLEQATQVAEDAAAEIAQAKQVAERAAAEMALAKQTAERANAELEQAKQIVANADAEVKAMKDASQQDVVEMAELRSKLESRSQAENEYNEKARLLTESMVRQERERSEIISWAEKEAKKIISKAENDALEVRRKKEIEFEKEMN